MRKYMFLEEIKPVVAERKEFESRDVLKMIAPFLEVLNHPDCNASNKTTDFSMECSFTRGWFSIEN